MGLVHYDHDGSARFVTFCTHRKIPILRKSSYRSIVAESINEIHKEIGFEFYGYVIMPDHLHLVLRPPEGTSLSKIISEIKSRSAKRVHVVLSPDEIHQFTVIRNRIERFALWQRRCYDHNCRGEEAVWEKVNYCHNNPVRKGLVSSPEEWQWSSYNWHHGCTDALLEIESLPKP
jgi:putative transposase